MRVSILGVVMAHVLICSLASADNWAHCRGPTGNGVAANATPAAIGNELFIRGERDVLCVAQ